MKRNSILALCVLTTFGAFAQKALVEDVDHAIGGYNSDFKAACEKILPALTNDESKGEAKTWYVAGKANFGLYDNLLGKTQLNPQNADPDLMGKSLLDGYKYYLTALPLDSVKQVGKDGKFKLNKDGSVKIKTKYAKDIVNSLVAHHGDYHNVASMLYDKKDFKKAAECWTVYAEMPFKGFVEREKFAVHDTIIGQIELYQGIALWQADDLKGAVTAFANARKHGNVSKEAFDYALSCCANLNDIETLVGIAKEALPIYGDKDPQYINILINDNLNKNKYDEAEKLIDEALVKNPNSSELYNVKGLMYEQKNEADKAVACFKEAVAKDAKSSQAHFNLGRMIMKEAVALQKDMESMTPAEYVKAKDAKLIPLYNEALPYMEKAFELDPENKNAKNILRNIYYQLGDEAKLQSLENAY